jgi:hypothetical protein
MKIAAPVALFAFRLYQHRATMRLPTRSRKTKTPTEMPAIVALFILAGAVARSALPVGLALEELLLKDSEEEGMFGPAVELDAGGDLVVTPAMGLYQC